MSSSTLTTTTICAGCNLILPTKRNYPKKGKFYQHEQQQQTQLCLACMPSHSNQNEQNNKHKYARIYRFYIQNTAEQDHRYRTCRDCKWMLPLELNFEVNNCTSTTGRIFRKWKCVQCRSVQKAHLRRLKKEIDMSNYYGKQCPICNKKMGKKGTARAIPDHCHKSGKLRGVICNNCNTAIGKLKDDPDVIYRALCYLIHNDVSKENHNSDKIMIAIAAPPSNSSSV